MIHTSLLLQKLQLNTKLLPYFCYNKFHIAKYFEFDDDIKKLAFERKIWFYKKKTNSSHLSCFVSEFYTYSCNFDK